jgi:hypothetical protein
MDFILGSITGFIVGFGLLYVQYHKSVISSAITSVKDDIATIHVKIDKLISK